MRSALTFLIVLLAWPAVAQTRPDPFADIVADIGTRNDPTPAPTPAPSAGWFSWFQTKSQRAEQADARGERCLTLRDLRGAIAAFSEAVSAQPGVAKYHFKLGVALGRARVLDQAADEFRAALKIDPAFPEARQKLALATQRLDEDRAQATAEALASRFGH